MAKQKTDHTPEQSAAPSAHRSWRARLTGWMRGPQDKPVDVLPVRVGDAQYRSKALPPTTLGLDQALIWVVIGLLAWGLVMVYSASIAMADNPRFGKILPYHFALRHAISLGVGFVAALLAFQIPMERWEQLAPRIFMLALVLLVIVLIPHVGVSVNGSRRWLSLGVMNFQPSELAKFAVLLYTADYMVRRMAVKERFFRAVLPMAFAVLIVGVLLLAEPDMGAFLVIVIIAMGILFLGGVNARMFFGMGALVVLAFVAMIATSPWRRERIFAYLNPWAAEHVLGKGYQLSHALIAVGRGEWFGVGLGGSVEKLHWLPEAHTDFLLAVIGEEFGFAGIVLLIGTFLWLTRRVIVIGRQAIGLERVFAGLTAQGIGLWLGFQAFINIGVNLGALPTKGLTLPLMSYGGSAILLNMVALAVVMRIDHENRTLMRGGQL